jgi:DNA-binding MarR family transcriptional regulator
MSDKNMRTWLTRMEEWWGYIVIKPKAAGASSKRMHPDAVVLPTAGGRKAQQVWRMLDGLIEKRWRERFGEDAIDDLRQSLATIVSQLDVELFDSLPILGYGLFSHGPEKPPRAQITESLAASARLSLPSLLSRVLLWFAIEFEQTSEVSLAISANILRLLSEEGIPLRDLPRMAAVSKEAVAMAMSFLSSRGYVLVASKPGGSRGKILLLTPKGRNAQEAYSKLVGSIEQRWQAQLGDGTVRLLRNSLTRLVGEPIAQRSPLFRGLEAYPNGWRASVPRPEGLPHYPMVLHRGGFPDGC